MYLVTSGILRARRRRPRRGDPCTRCWSRSTGTRRAPRWSSCCGPCCGSTPPTRPATRPSASSSWPTPCAGSGSSPRSCPRPRAGPTWSPACPAATGTRPRCCSTATSTWSRPRPGAGGPPRAPRPPGGGGDAAPLLLNGHVDVVAAEAGRWRHPPFAGEVHDGVIWGRGAVDMKQMVAMSVVTVGLLTRLGVPLRRDLKLAAVADEEAGCAFGSAWLGDPHPEKVRAGHALGEVGG